MRFSCELKSTLSREYKCFRWQVGIVGSRVATRGRRHSAQSRLHRLSSAQTRHRHRRESFTSTVRAEGAESTPSSPDLGPEVETCWKGTLVRIWEFAEGRRPRWTGLMSPRGSSWTRCVRCVSSCVDSRVATPRDGPDHATWMQRRIQPKAPKLNDSSPPLRLPRRWTGTCVPAP